MSEVYEASRIKRRRATKDEMAERARFLIDYADQHGPVTVRGLYYQAEVAGVPGIGKDEGSYSKVQRQVLNLRRSGDLSYDTIADATRWMRKPKTYNSVEAALKETARTYRKSLWLNNDDYVEIWIEKDALAGVVLPVTRVYDVPLMVTRGYTSETFAYESVEQYDEDKTTYIYALYDYDRSGRDAANSLQEKLERFAREAGKNVVFERIAITEPRAEVLHRRGLSRPHKRETTADRKWVERVCDWAVELDAIEPDSLRGIVERAINLHLPQDQLEILKVAEQSERELLRAFVREQRGAL